MRSKLIGSFLALNILAAQPAAAAGAVRHSAVSDHRQAAFGGVTVRLPLGRNASAKPEARLRLTTYRMNLAKPADVRAFNPNGLELGVSKVGKPILFSGGQNTADIKQKMGLSTTTTLLIVGGIVLVVVVAAAVASAAPTPGPHEGAFD